MCLTVSCVNTWIVLCLSIKWVQMQINILFSNLDSPSWIRNELLCLMGQRKLLGNKPSICNSFLLTAGKSSMLRAKFGER